MIIKKIVILEYVDLIEKVYKVSVIGIKENWFQSFEGNELWYNYILNLNSPFRETYLIGILDSQVYNSGLEQYFSNGFGQFAKETIIALQEIGDQKNI